MTTITVSETTNLPIEKLTRHPSNRPLGLNLEKIEQIKASISQYGFYSNQPIVVRPVNSHYEIIKGEHRFVAARELGFDEVPCSVQNMSDAEALVQLIIGNIQTENKPLEIGLNAMEYTTKYSYNGNSIKEYAEKSSVGQQSIYRYIQAAEVYKHVSSFITGDKTLDEHVKLAEIGRCDQSSWVWVHNFVVSNDLSKDATVTICQSVKDIEKAITPEDSLLPWIDRTTVLTEVSEQVIKGTKKGQGINADDFANKVKAYCKVIKHVVDLLANMEKSTLYDNETPFEFDPRVELLKRIAKSKARNITDVGEVDHAIKKYVSDNLAAYAMLIAKKHNDAQRVEREAARQTEIARINSLPYRLLVGKAERLEGIFDESVDIIITSPPYNLGDDNWPMGGDGRKSRDGIGYQKHDDTMSQDEYEAWQILVCNALYRVAKPGASFFYNHKVRTFDGKAIFPHKWLDTVNNPWTIRQEWIWNRISTHNHSAQLAWPIDERIFWMTKGKPTLTEQPIGCPTIWEEFGPIPNTWHPAPFTIELPRMLLKAINARPGSVVLDPFAGSCTTLKAALEIGCRAIGVDVSKDYLAKAAQENGWEYYHE